MEATRLLLVDNGPLFSELLRRTLRGEPNMEVAGVSCDCETALRLARELRPAAVVMEIEPAGGEDGIETALKIKAVMPVTGIVILSAHNDRR